MDFDAAIVEWKINCDSGKCSDPNRQVLYDCGNLWVRSNQNWAVKEWFRRNFQENDWGRQAWLFVEQVGTRHNTAKKNEMFERSLTKENPAGFLFDYLRRMLWMNRWDIEEVREIERKINFVPSTEREEPTALFWEDFGSGSIAELEALAKKILRSDPFNSLVAQLDGRPGDWLLLYLDFQRVQMNDKRLTPGLAQMHSLPGQAQRYERIRLLHKQISIESRASLATHFLKADQVDPWDAKLAATIFLRELQKIMTSEQKIPEDFRSAFSNAVKL
jgi:hypothetical protein